MKADKQVWLEYQMKVYPKADKAVLKFIANILYYNQSVVPQAMFTHGYCWYFAHMLRLAFKRGIVCYAYDKNHFVWLDGTSESRDLAYDINGVNKDWEHLIPEDKLGDSVWDFKHVEGKQSSMEDQELASLLLQIIENKEYAK